jgi:DNA-binding GntR family transcriptional regulator
VLDAVRARDGQRAAALARKHLYEYYSVFLAAEDRKRVEALVESPAARITG